MGAVLIGNVKVPLMWNNPQCLNCLKRAHFLATEISALRLLQRSRDGTHRPGRLDVSGACSFSLDIPGPISCVKVACLVQRCVLMSVAW